MNFSASAKLARRYATAFSLVEVVLAIGVASFTLLSMVALLPMGLKTAHEAAEATTQSQIIQYCRNQLELTSFTNLSSWSTATDYFDNQGLPTTSTDPEGIYTVTFHIGNINLSTNSSASVSYLASNTNLPNNAADAQMVQVIMVNRTIAGSAGSNVFPIVVPNAGF